MNLTLADHILFALVVAVPLLAYANYRRLVLAVERREPGARLHRYLWMITQDWALTALAVTVWAQSQRPLSSLGLTLAGGSRLLVGVGVTAVIIAFLGRQWAVIRRLDERRRSGIRRQLAGAAGLLPSDETEHSG